MKQACQTRAARGRGRAWTAAALGAAMGCAACAPLLAPGPAPFDALHQLPPLAPHAIAGHPVSDADYERLVAWGADWFRGETFGDERTITDVLGLLSGSVDVPCESGPPGCVRRQPVFERFVQALDDLDGVRGNLFTGNGGPEGPGFTSDLVIRFPPGALLRGVIPVPEALHTGLDVEAGAPWPLGIVEVEAPPEDQTRAYLAVPASLGAGPGSPRRVRLGLTCAVCHYSLDVDGDGVADLRSARLGRATPGAAYRPEHAWAIGNQDLHVAWLLALSENPLLVFTLMSGPVASSDPRDAMTFARWIRDNYERAPEAVMRQVTASMLLQPRGSADDTPDGLHDTVQIPAITTLRNWPYNSVGAFCASDLNSTVWTGSLDFTGLVALAADRVNARSGVLYWEPSPVYALFPAALYADVITRSAPVVRWDPGARGALIDDILGVSDGVPGLLDPGSLWVMQGPSGALPDDIYSHPANAGRRRTPAAIGGDAPARVGTLALLGTRIRTPARLRATLGLDALAARYHLDPDELFNDVVSSMLDWQPPAPDVSPLIAGQWPLVERGYRVFREERCDGCHAGAFFTDNQVKPFAATEREDFGVSPPSTAGWMFVGRDAEAAIGTDPRRARATRPEELFLAPGYDRRTGAAVTTGGIASGLLGERPIGYKTATLRGVWATPPYLHDGGVGVGFAPSVRPPDDLGTRLRAARTGAGVVYGMGALLDAFEQGQLAGAPVRWRRPDAALSLQALLLRSERRKVIASNRAPTMHVPPGGTSLSARPLPERVSMESLGASGVGHELWIDDVPGGDRVTALVAFLLALDDRPCELPGEASRCAR